jgi:hypothetical protein
MIIYNVTCSVDKEIAEAWTSWMKDKHIPEVLRTALFTECRILKVLTHDDDQTFSFAVQYHSNSIKDVEEFLNKYDSSPDSYSDKVVSFPTLLEES